MSRRRPARVLARLVAFVVAVALVPVANPPAPASAAVSGQAADVGRTGWFPDQPGLSPQLVSGGTFGKLWDVPVDGQVYAQPVAADGTLLVATQNDKVYGFDQLTGAIKWQRSVGVAFNAAVDLKCGDISPTVGVTGTPVVDQVTGVAYFYAKSYASQNTGPADYWLHAVKVATGDEQPNFPVRLVGSATNDPARAFTPTTQLQRPGLIMLNGVVYAAFGAHCDIGPYAGWVIGVNATSGAITTMWSSESGIGNNPGAGIWQAGGAIASDGPGQLLVVTGNGPMPTVPTPGHQPPGTLGESFIRLGVQPDGSLRATDFFTPYDADQLDQWDADFGSGAPIVLPERYYGTPSHPRLTVQVGKAGYVYLLDRDNLGGFRQGVGAGDGVVARLGPYGGVWSKPAIWPGDGGYVYIPTASGGTSTTGTAGNLRVYKYATTASGDPTLVLAGTSTDAFGFGSGAPVVTSDGTTSGTALVWTVWMPNGGGKGAELRAYDAVPVGGVPKLRWRGALGTGTKFSQPAVDGGKLYVGTSDHVFAFGSPVSAPLAGSAQAFGTTTVGAAKLATMTVTANQPVTVSKLTVAGTGFSAGAASKPLPAQLATGDTLQVPLTFAPAAVGSAAGTITFATSSGNVGFGLTGTGQSATGSLVVNPAVVSFGGTAVGSNLSASATLTNGGATDVTINAVSVPAAPFSASGLPASGTVLAPGQSLALTLTFAPTTTGLFADAVTFSGSDGDHVLNLAGTAALPPKLEITPITVSYPATTVGASSTAQFTVANTGGSPLTILKSKPPAQGEFTALDAIPEGTTIQPGASLTPTVRFSPNAAGVRSDVWVLNGDDGSGLQTVSFSATATPGVVPAPSAGGWQLNGSARMEGADLVLTPAESFLSGTAFWPASVPSQAFSVAFDATISGGGGADGMTLAFVDPRVGPAATGQPGGGLGFSGLPGTAVALDTWQSGNDPSGNFVGVTTGPSDPLVPDVLGWAATATNVPLLRSGTRHVLVTVDHGDLSVLVDNRAVLRTQVNLAPQMMLGFSAGTGGLNDRHAVSNVVVNLGESPAPTLRLTSRQASVAGATPSTRRFTYSGLCPTAVTPVTLGDGESADVSLKAAPYDGCALKQSAVAATDVVTASVNGAAPVPLLKNPDGTVTLPSFPLQPGPNSVDVTVSALPTLLPTFSDPHWRFNGSALPSSATPSDAVLTLPLPFQSGTTTFDVPVPSSNLTVAFDSEIGGGSGGDGTTLFLADPATDVAATGAIGSGFGFGGISGTAFALSTVQAKGYPSLNFVGVTNGPADPANPEVLAFPVTATNIPQLRQGIHHVLVSVRGNLFEAWIDGARVISTTLNLPPLVRLGFSAATGFQTDMHRVANVRAAIGDLPAANVVVTNEVAAPAGTAAAVTPLTFAAQCTQPSATQPIAPGATGTLVASGIPGDACTVSRLPVGPGWTTLVGVDGAAPLPAAVLADGTAIAPTVTLTPGVTHTVRFVSSYAIGASAGGGWTQNGSSVLSGTQTILTPAKNYKTGTSFWPGAVSTQKLTVAFDAFLDSGTSADGMTMLLADPAAVSPTSVGGTGSAGAALGMGGLKGVGVALDTYQNPGDPSYKFIGITDGLKADGATMNWLASYTNSGLSLRNVTNKMTVTVTNGNLMTVSRNGKVVVSKAVSLPPYVMVGFTASTGRRTDRHAVQNVVISTS